MRESGAYCSECGSSLSEVPMTSAAATNEQRFVGALPPIPTYPNGAPIPLQMQPTSSGGSAHSSASLGGMSEHSAIPVGCPGMCTVSPARHRRFAWGYVSDPLLRDRPAAAYPRWMCRVSPARHGRFAWGIGALHGAVMHHFRREVGCCVEPHLSTAACLHGCCCCCTAAG